MRKYHIHIFDQDVNHAAQIEESVEVLGQTLVQVAHCAKSILLTLAKPGSIGQRFRWHQPVTQSSFVAIILGFLEALYDRHI